MASDLVATFTPRPAVLRITLRRPDKRNAINLAMLRDLTASLSNVSDDVRVVELRGDGPMFCAGLDLKEAVDDAAAQEAAELLAGVYATLSSLPRAVSVCVAQGGAYGGGVGLALACDLAVVGDDVKVAFPELRRGIVPALVGILLRDRVPMAVWKALLLTGWSLDATAAQAAGLFAEVAPADRLDERAAELVGDLLANGPEATARLKSLLWPSRPDFAAAIEANAVSRASDEYAEGTAAFRAKRPPAWAPPTA